jgi:hypothetical protein
MEKKQEEKNEKPTPVMKRLARPMSPKELQSVAGGGCGQYDPTSRPSWDNTDYLN